MKRFFKLFLIVAFAFTLSFGLASCGGGDTVSKEDYDKKVAELASVQSELDALKADSVLKTEYDAKVAELAAKVAELATAKEEAGKVKGLTDQVATLTASVNGIKALLGATSVEVGLPAGKTLTEGKFEINRAEEHVLLGLAVKGETKTKANEWFNWSTTDVDGLKVDAAGKITAFNAGDYTIKIVSKANAAVFAELNVKVIDDTPTFDDTGKTKVVVGTPQMNGLFIAGFGNSAYDVSIRNLIHGYSTIWITSGEKFIWDTKAVLTVEPTTELLPKRSVGEGATAVEVQDKVFSFTLQQDLKWNDGTPITAKNYVFSLLFSASKQWKATGASSSAGDQLLGYKEFRADDAVIPTGGSTPVFKGVKVTGEYTFDVIANGENLPYFYESTMVALSPAPMHVYAPGADVVSDANGSYLTGLTQAHADAVKSNYLKNPTVSCGPYKFVFFKNQVVRVEKNPLFKTDGEGYAPKIDIIEQKWINQDTDVYQVIAGEVDIVAGVVQGAKIEALIKSTTAQTISYDRNGYGMMALVCDFGPTKEAKVRQALGMLVDRQEFVEEILGGYGVLVNGAYGTSQWMYKEKQTEIDNDLIKYGLNTDKANEYLDQTEWKFESDGVTPFDKTKAGPETNYYRYNAAKEKLVIRHFGTTENTITDLIALRLPVNCESAGIEFTVDFGGFDTLLEHYYYGYQKEDKDRVYHSFNLATSFGSPYDPYYSWHSSWVGKSYYNTNQLADDLFDEYTEAMQKCEATTAGTAEFANIWLNFQKRWNALLPSIPLYSNTYFDACTKRIVGLQTTPTFGWAYAIIRAEVVE